MFGAISIGGWWTNAHVKRITITKQDVVRYCTNSRHEGRTQKEIKYYCQELRGDEYIAQGVTPNYGEYPEIF
jgi:hypothetical protein